MCACRRCRGCRAYGGTRTWNRCRGCRTSVRTSARVEEHAAIETVAATRNAERTEPRDPTGPPTAARPARWALSQRIMPDQECFWRVPIGRSGARQGVGLPMSCTGIAGASRRALSVVVLSWARGV